MTRSVLIRAEAERPNGPFTLIAMGDQGGGSYIGKFPSLELCSQEVVNLDEYGWPEGRMAVAVCSDGRIWVMEHQPGVWYLGADDLIDVSQVVARTGETR